MMHIISTYNYLLANISNGVGAMTNWLKHYIQSQTSIEISETESKQWKLVVWQNMVPNNFKQSMARFHKYVYHTLYFNNIIYW